MPIPTEILFGTPWWKARTAIEHWIRYVTLPARQQDDSVLRERQQAAYDALMNVPDNHALALTLPDVSQRALGFDASWIRAERSLVFLARPESETIIISSPEGMADRHLGTVFSFNP